MPRPMCDARMRASWRLARAWLMGVCGGFGLVQPNFNASDAARCHALLVGGPPEPGAQCKARHPLRSEKPASGGVIRLRDLRPGKGPGSWKTVSGNYPLTIA